MVNTKGLKGLRNFYKSCESSTEKALRREPMKGKERIKAEVQLQCYKAAVENIDRVIKTGDVMIRV